MARFLFEAAVTIAEMDAEYGLLEDSEIRRIDEELLDRVAGMEPPLLVVDMNRTEFIGSTFLEVLLRAWKRLKCRRGRMAICSPRATCREVFEVSKLDTIWPIYPTRNDAVRAILAEVESASS